VAKLGPPLAIALAAGVCAFAIVRGCTRGVRAEARGRRATAPTVLLGRRTSFTLYPESSRVAVRTLDGATSIDLDIALVVDGVARPIQLGRDEVTVENGERGILFHVDFDDARAAAIMELALDVPSDALVAQLSVVSVVPQAPPRLPDPSSEPEHDHRHTLALRLELPTEGRTAFVSGVGEIADVGTVSGGMATLDAPPNTIGLVSTHGRLEVSDVAGEPEDDASATPPQHGQHEADGTPMRLAVTSPRELLEPSRRVTTDLRLVVAPSSAAVWGTLHQLAGDVTARVKGLVTGTHERARVFGFDAEGLPEVLALADANGRFALDVPKTVVQWYAAIDTARTSAPVNFPPGTPWDLKLDVSPGGELRVRITDADTSAPLTARLLVHGIEGTLDPSFGPDYRASGAGPIIDALRGDVATPLPVGRYRVSATKGLEWSIDTKIIDIAAGRTATCDLAPRHVVPTPGVVGCDLHVHARPSFDSPVLPEDRVLSLVSAGIDFAVPSEHNIVGDYGPMIATLDLTHDLAYVPGVEITTYNPRFGHFGLFPYPVNKKIPPYRGTTPSALFPAAHRGDPTRILQVNHPRLPHAIGYFDVYHFDPNAPHPPGGMRLDFDSIEVYNGYDLSKPDRVDAVLRDYFALLNQGHRYVATGSSDSHRIQYQWAGYPRTMVTVGEEAAGDKGAPVDPQAVVAALKKGHATVTSGPIIELEVAGSHPGDEVFTTDDPVPLHVRVRAAPWVDVTSLDVVVGGKTVQTIAIASQPTKIGPEEGTLPEAQARTIRYEGELKISVGPDNTWLMAIARGARRLDDDSVLPFMPVPPMGITNPVWITRDKSKLLAPGHVGQGPRPHNHQ